MTQRRTQNNETYFDTDAPLGVGRRFTHEECGNRRAALIVTRNPNGWAYYCHFCGERGFKRLAGQAPKFVAQRLRDYCAIREATDGVIKQGSLRLPPDFTMDLPLQAKVWLTRYRITPQLHEKYHVGFSNLYNRLLFPYYTGSELKFIVGRNLEKDNRPKYLTVKRQDVDTPAYLIESLTDTLILVEDIISAIRIHEATHLTTVAILGSSYRDYFFHLAKTFKRVVVWLDDDKRIVSSRIVSRLLNLTSTEASRRFTNLDPKDYSDEELRSIIGV